MRSPLRVALGIIFALLGSLWSLQGFGVISGSAMSNTVTWSIIGPIVLLAGLVNIYWGWRTRT
ncbi:hypothetical protein [Nocardia acidivorans]|uniref:hypothetical protein n=1 Tax=Nocardia acidivorans TaxID=404580 RepID=UPI00082B0677|nr:hypothetical protein [Nocardia acidivorans]